MSSSPMNNFMLQFNYCTDETKTKDGIFQGVENGPQDMDGLGAQNFKGDNDAVFKACSVPKDLWSSAGFAALKDRHQNLDFLDWFEVIIAGCSGILGSANCDDFSGENPIQWQFRSHQSHMWIVI
ncbi:hypothetical protein POTOM_017837 [Populus tomentosa]|uniref:Uncharacterized protein n=1 Tax=Populus tomentosa TaxID=118781 RepID=A0A8X8A512_POPTO|nr:hypothetical protein POTOM_017837 [Populus tomentosa]